jgi:UDP-glucose 4-epimerase
MRQYARRYDDAHGYDEVYRRRGWRIFPSIDRVYVSERARRDLGWRPRYDFARVVDLIDSGEEPRSPLARLVGGKGYHREPAATPKAEV